MRRNGLGTYYDLPDVPEGRRRWNADRTRVAAFWVSRVTEDRYDCDTWYGIAVWDAATGKELESYTRGHCVNHQAGTAVGRPVADVCFDADGRLRIVFDDGSSEPAKREIPPAPEDEWPPDAPPPPLFGE